MKCSMFFKIGSIAVTALMLAACSHSNTGDYESGSKADSQSGQSSANSYGMRTGAGYRMANSTNGFHVNSLKAPTDQTYYFSFDSNKVRSSDIRAIDMQADYLASHPRARIRLEGNTDNLGSPEYNVGLGWRRDQSVEHYLTDRGVSPKQIQMVSYGKEHPAVAGTTAQDRSLNRRVNLIYKVS